MLKSSQDTQLWILRISFDLAKRKNISFFIHQLFDYKPILEALKGKSEAEFGLSVKEIISDMLTHSRTVPGWCGDEWEVIVCV